MKKIIAIYIAIIVLIAFPPVFQLLSRQGAYGGEGKNGKYDGFATHTFANGDKYVGELKDGKPVGGWYHWQDGKKTWSYENANGKWVHKDSK